MSEEISTYKLGWEDGSMPRYRLDENGDRILTDTPEAIAKRFKTVRRKAEPGLDPERYGLATDS